MSRDCCVALPRSAVVLSAVCDCGISVSYSLNILMRKFRGWQPAGHAEDGETQVYMTSPVSAVHLVSVSRSFDIGTHLFVKY